ncbi:calcium-binding protein [Chloroflexi bacterium TSY]|nr:calcium-binding protein [Chloroflexi bacterium TSY]
MRLLITIPHFFNPSGDGRYGSTQPDPKPRIAAFTQCIRSLRTIFSNQQELWYRDGDRLHPQPTNQQNLLQLDVIVCTCGDLHALEQVPLPPETYQHQIVDCEPMFLGYECHQVLHQNLGSYDLYGYMEDDLVLNDPAFFAKINWFAEQAGEHGVLQPNRYERMFTTSTIKKVYIDFEFYPPEEVVARANSPVIFEQFGQMIELHRTTNPHAGCFFLTQAQMDYWTTRDDFLQQQTSYVGPLESAATLGLYRNFEVYKPAPQNANFLEIEHYGQMWSRRLPGVRFPK